MRRLRTILLSTPCIAISIWLVLWKRQYDTQAALQEQDNECASFRHFSSYRKNFNYTLERQIDLALLDIEHKSSSTYSDAGTVDKIWQIWRNESVPDTFYQSDEWTLSNPGWTYELLTDRKALDFISGKLSDIPYLETLYHSCPRQILQADLLRYLLLWYYGGLYVDIDIFPTTSVRTCPTLQPLFDFDVKRNISLVVGVEIDEPYATARKSKAWRWSRTYQFVQYSFYAPRRFSPILRKVIVRGIAHSIQHQRNTASWYRPSGRFDNDAVLETTGPGMFTDAILDSLSETLPSTHSLKRKPEQPDSCPAVEDGSSGSPDNTSPRQVTWFPFHKLEQSLWIDDTESDGLDESQRNGGLLVLPVNVWGNGQRHSGSGDFDTPGACLNHRFSRSWAHSSF